MLISLLLFEKMSLCNILSNSKQKQPIINLSYFGEIISPQKLSAKSRCQNLLLLKYIWLEETIVMLKVRQEMNGNLLLKNLQMHMFCLRNFGAKFK